MWIWQEQTGEIRRQEGNSRGNQQPKYKSREKDKKTTLKLIQHEFYINKLKFYHSYFTSQRQREHVLAVASY